MNRHLRREVQIGIEILFILAVLVGIADYRGTDYFGEFFGIQTLAVIIAAACFVTLMKWGRRI